MDAITVMIDGLPDPSAFLAELVSRLRSSGPEVSSVGQPVVPGKAEFAALLQAAQHTTERLTTDDVPSPELISTLASVELLEVARLTVATVQQAWCLTARSVSTRARINVCTDSLLWVALTARRSENVSDEYRAITERAEAFPLVGSAKVLHLYAGPDERDAAAYHERLVQTGKLGAVISSVDDAVRETLKVVRDTVPPAVDPTEFF